MDAPEILVYHNLGRLNPNQFGEKTVQRESIVTKLRFESNKPAWFNTRISWSSLNDEIEYLQFGQTSEYDFFALDFLPLQAS